MGKDRASRKGEFGIRARRATGYPMRDEEHIGMAVSGCSGTREGIETE